MDIKKVFIYDRLIEKESFCNFDYEKKELFKSINHGQCVKIYGPRNFGKTSLVKNLISKEWESAKAQSRLVIYADLYSVQNLDDIFEEILKAFSNAFQSKKNLFDKSLDWMKSLKYLKPTWSPSTNPDEFGEFSLTIDTPKHKLDLNTVFENINNLCQNKKFEFLIILDEFQEIAKIKKAEAILRGALQLLNSKTPVIILGSKQHILTNIFEKPRAPFYSWGNTIEIGPIDFDTYTEYINERLAFSKLNLNKKTSEYLQLKLNRIPESINRFCDYLCKNFYNIPITNDFIDRQLKQFVSLSRSNYEHLFFTLSSNEQKFISTIAKEERVTQILGKNFLSKLPASSKSTISNIFKRMLDQSFITQHLSTEGLIFYSVTDPFLALYCRLYK